MIEYIYYDFLKTLYLLYDYGWNCWIDELYGSNG